MNSSKLRDNSNWQRWAVVAGLGIFAVGSLSQGVLASGPVPGESAASMSTRKPTIVAIPSPVPSYMDRGTTMVPLKPVLDFLGIQSDPVMNGVSLTQVEIATAKTLVVTIHFGETQAKVNDGSSSRMIPLSRPAEARLSNGFVPLRFFADVFGVSTSFRVPDNAIVLRTPEKIGILTPANPAEYTGRNAATVTITNRIGKALSLQLNGPQRICIELGHGQSLTRKMPPGVYTYTAGVSGLKPRYGTRRFHAAKRASWSWGRR